MVYPIGTLVLIDRNSSVLQAFLKMAFQVWVPDLQKLFAYLPEMDLAEEREIVDGFLRSFLEHNKSVSIQSNGLNI